MEPPTKRRRLVESDPEDSDDDELAYEPHEVVARSDPDYRLNLRRAYADHKFQATMAHIFQKYGRDFEGIGDEIDMVTGEIVVNNGHLDRMRNEGDVGVEVDQDRDQEQEQDDSSEDEGIALGDLFGDDEDPQLDLMGETWDGNNERRNLQERAPHHPIATLSTNIRPGPFPDDLPSIYSDSIHGFPGLDYAPPPYGLPPMNNDFGIQPLGMGPWDLPPDIAQIPLSAPRPPSFLNIRTGRYEFPVQNGKSSIWARGSHNDDEEPAMPLPMLATKPQTSKPVVKCRKKISHPQIEIEAEDDFMSTTTDAQVSAADHDKSVRKGVVRTGKRASSLVDKPVVGSTDVAPGANLELSKRPELAKRNEPNCSDRHLNRSRPDLESQAESLLTPVQPNKSQTRPKASQVDEVEGGSRSNIEKSRLGQDTQSNGLKHSSLVQHQPELLDEVISWSHLDMKNRPSTKVLVELVPLDPQAREEYIRIDIEDDTVDSSLRDTTGRVNENDERPKSTIATIIPDSQSSGTAIPDSQSSGSSIPDSRSTGTVIPGTLPSSATIPDSQSSGLVIPNSQSSGTSVGSVLPVAPTADASREPQPEQTNISFDDVFALSDDEAPVFFEPQRAKMNSSEIIPDTQSQTSSSAPLTAHLEAIPEYENNQIHEDSCVAGETSQNDIHEITETTPAEENSTHPINEDITPASLVEITTEPVDSNNDENPVVAEESSEKPEEAIKSLPAPNYNETSNEVVASGDDAVYVDSTDNVSTNEHDSIPQDSLVAPDTSRNDQTEASPTTSEIPNHQQSQPPSSNTSKDEKLGEKPGKKSSAPSTPRHAIRHSIRAPSSRRSVLSLVSDDEGDGNGLDNEMDELGRSTGFLNHPSTGSSIVRKMWKSSARTTEIYRTPVKRNRTTPASPGSTVKTPGGTIRTCGVEGFRCERDFCFTCL
jgi:hypothetical protein